MFASNIGRQESIRALLRDYRDLAPPELQYYERLPCAVEMLRIIHAGRPAIFHHGFNPNRNNSEDSPREIDWSDPGALCSVIGDHQVSIAITPHGLADALHEDEETGETYFVQPLTEKMAMRSFFERLDKGESDEICYLQSQNGNIERFDYVNLADEDVDADEDSPELAVLQSYLKTDVESVTEALGRKPDAVNLWVGDSRSVTSLHKDPYENIYHVLSGSKTFRLFAPVEGYLLDTSFYPTATYVRQASSNPNPTEKSTLVIRPDPEPARPIPWISVDPLRLPKDTPLQPITVKLREGETLFLPAGWYHHVMQEEGKNGICVAVNYWYDQTLQADQYALDRYVWRSIGRQDLLGDESSDEGSDNCSDGE